jgi:predicted amidohydrolase
MSTLNITLVQTNLFWEDKAANLHMLDEKIGALPDTGHIIILPEMFTTGFTMNPSGLAEKMNGSTIQWMKNKSKEKKSIVTGSIIIEENESDEKKIYYNRLIWVMPNNQVAAYDKRHLFALSGENEHYRYGEKRVVF